ncbi:MAG TPA: efflux RND transporter periplasmic adaptor subunit [Candidatus Binataceae bacterium]|nr:efflux RND transporter periplasmic adaptor subunit [Candidatus Binataceae bacterium]
MAEGMSAKKRGILLWVLLALVVLVFVAAALLRLVRTKQVDARLVNQPIPVQTMPATVKEVNELIGASGTIQPSMPVTLTAKVVAQVLTVPVDLGSIVRPGQLLVELDPRLYQANLTSMQVTYEHAKNQVAREETLRRKGFAAEMDVENARVAEAIAYAQVVSAQIDLANTTLRSSAPAVVLSRSVNPGEMTRVDEQLFQLGVLDPVLFDAAVSEDKIGAVHLGMEGEVRTDAFQGELFSGLVQKIDSQVDPTTRTFGAYVRLANPDLKLKKDVTGYARLKGQRMALTVLSTAVVNPVGDHATVFIVDGDGRAKIREVHTGLTVGNATEILSGLDENEQVVVVGQFGLHDNDRVRVNQSAPWNKS